MTVEDFTEALKRRNTTPAVDLTEDGLAAEFTRRHRDHLRYVALWGAWMHWDGRCWQREPTLMAFDLARAVCRDAGDGLDNAKLRARILSAGTRAAVENLARSDRAHAALPEQWDAYPWHLNTTGGIVDLVTATVRPHDPLGYHTKITAVAPGGECPLWRDFLKRITDGDDDLQAYLQQLGRLRPDRFDPRARPAVRLRHRRERQGDLSEHSARHHARLCLHRANGDLHGDDWRAPSDRSRHAARRAARDRAGNGTGPPMGRS